MTSILWHDYETFGTDPALDRPSQFAAIRTDLDLEPVDDPFMLYCRPSDDVLPSIDACLITGITPQEASEKGLPEPDFIAQINHQFMRPGTCGAGYNSIRFDDEVTRYCLYRNFYEPYAREWQNGNSRWDIIDMVRATYALRPQGIEWPESEPGVPSFRLELLTQANGLAHDSAHDALSDVRATIDLAKLIRTTHPKLYEYCWQLRDKHHVSPLIDLRTRKPLVHVSSKISAARGCTTLIMPVTNHPQNSNGVLCLDLTVDPDSWLNLSLEEMRDRLYKKSEDLEEGEVRIPLKTVHLNRSPVLCPLSMLDQPAAKRLGIDVEACERHWQKLLEVDGLEAKLSELVNEPFVGDSDVEASLYSGFVPKSDRSVCERVISADEHALKDQSFIFQDERLTELLFRYKARHFPQTLPADQINLWKEEVARRYFSSLPDEPNVFDSYMGSLNQRMTEQTTEKEKIILNQLNKWALDFQKRYYKA